MSFVGDFATVDPPRTSNSDLEFINLSPSHFKNRTLPDGACNNKRITIEFLLSCTLCIKTLAAMDTGAASCHVN